MKRILALVACLAINGLTVHHLFAQRSVSRARTVTVHRSGGYLGVGVAEIDDDRAKALNLKETRGVEIKNVEPDSAAEKAGLKVGDVLVGYNGQSVEGVEQFQRLVLETPAGHRVALDLMRGGASQRLNATIAQRAGGNGPDNWNFNFDFPEAPEPPHVEFKTLPIPPTPPMPSLDLPGGMLYWRNSTIGIETESLHGQLAEYFGVKDGVLVRSVMKNSPAEKAGVKAGDVVTHVGGTSVTSANEISREVRAARNKQSVSLGVVRNHKEMTLDVKPSTGWQMNSEGEKL